jgi:xylulokinase
MALIGVGAVEPGIACDRAGTSEGINVCSPLSPAAGELRVLPHIREGLWNVSALLPVSGRLFEWFRTLTGQESRAYEDVLEELIPLGGREKGPPSALSPQGACFFPQIAPPGTVPPGQTSPRRSFVMAPDLSSRAELGRGVLEAIGFMVREALETLDRRGFRVREMRISGGQGKNARWNQLKADISGVDLLVPELKDAELAGDAVLAAIALGEAADLDEALGRMIHLKERYTPAPGAASAYEEKFRAYGELRSKLRELF